MSKTNMGKKVLLTFLAAALLLTNTCSCTSIGGTSESRENFAEQSGGNIAGRSGEQLQNDDQPQSLVIILGNHANARKLTKDTLGEDITKQIERCINVTKGTNSYTIKAHVSVIVCDGKPESVPIVNENGENFLTNEAPNEKLLAAYKEEMVDNIIDFLMSDNLKANDEEVDLLSAIDEGQKILNADQGYGHNMLIVDTGICTSGDLNMTTLNISEGEASEVLSRIEDGIPNIDGTVVTFKGLGNVGGKQDDLSGNALTRRFLDIWRGIIVDYGHGTLLNDSLMIAPHSGDDLFSEKNGGDYPWVTQVVFKDETGAIIPTPSFTIKTKTPENVPSVTLKFDETSIGFVAQSTEFLDESVAISILDGAVVNIVNFLNDSVESDGFIYVVGSIAKVHPEDDYHEDPYASGRAQKVVDTLLERYKDLPKDRIKIIDAGTTEFSWRNAVEFPDGTEASRDLEAMSKNRVVAIFSNTCTDLEQELRDAGYVE